MANLKDIKNRIQSVKSTQKITRAMKMVAAAKVKKAENTVKMSRPFTRELNSMFKKLLSSVGTYLSQPQNKKCNRQLSGTFAGKRNKICRFIGYNF